MGDGTGGRARSACGCGEGGERLLYSLLRVLSLRILAALGRKGGWSGGTGGYGGLAWLGDRGIVIGTGDAVGGGYPPACESASLALRG